VAEAPASAGWCPDLQIPSILRWWDGSRWTTVGTSGAGPTTWAPAPPRAPAGATPRPLRVPELAPSRWVPPAREIAERDELRVELADLKVQIPILRHQRDVMRGELVGLMNEVSSLGRDRDGLVTATADLHGELEMLRRQHQELECLRSEIGVLRQEKARLDKEMVASLRDRTTEGSPPTSTSYQRFHDS